MEDNWGDKSKISLKLIGELNRFNKYIDTQMVITSGYRPKKSPADSFSYHQTGEAVDVVFPLFKGSLVDMFLKALRFNFNGVGIYKDWHFEGKTVGGLHLDVRNKDSKSIWMAYNVKGVQTYDNLSFANLKIRGFV